MSSGGKKRHGSPLSSFHVTIKGRDKKSSRKGTLEVTTEALIFREDLSQSRHSWLLTCLKNFEITGDKTFLVYTGDPTLPNDGVLNFSTPKAKQIQNLVSTNLNALRQNNTHSSYHGSTQSLTSASPLQATPSTSDESVPVHWRLNTRTSLDSSSCSSTSPTHSRTSSVWSDSVFEVERVLADSSKRDHGILEFVGNDVVFTESSGKNKGKKIVWPIKVLRRFGYEGDMFTFETGRKFQGGPGRYTFKTPHCAEINAALRVASSGVKEESSSPSPNLDAGERRPTGQHQQYFPSPVRRAPFLPPSQPPPLPPPLPATEHPPVTSKSSHHGHVTQQDQTTHPFKRSDSLIRRARSAYDLNRCVFDVRNITNDNKEVRMGTMEITSTDLIYIDTGTNEKWKWPFKYLRKYGCEGKIFSFEAGRRCPGGEGLYAFHSNQADKIQEAIIEKIYSKENTVAPATRVSLTPGVVGRSQARGVVSSTSQFSLQDSSAPPTMKSNDYYFDTIPKSVAKSSQSKRPEHSQSSITATPTTTPTSLRSERPLSMSSAAATPPTIDSFTTVNNVMSRAASSIDVTAPSTNIPVAQFNPSLAVDSLTSEGYAVVDITRPPATTEAHGATSSQLQIAKTHLKSVKPEHLYDVPENYGKNASSGRALAQGAPSDVKPVFKKPAKKMARYRTSSAEKPKKQRGNDPGQKKFVKRSSEGDFSTKAPEDHNSASKEPQKKKTQSSMLNRLIAKKSSESRKRAGKPFGDEAVDSPYPVEDNQGPGTEDMYVNFGRLRRNTPYSASTDDLLSSVERSCTSQSAVPLPQLHHGQNPPSGRRQIEDRESGASHSYTSSQMYQNLEEVRNSATEDSPPTTSISPPISDASSHIYTNFQLLSTEEDEQWKKESEEAKSTIYTELEIFQSPPPSPSSPHARHEKLSKKPSPFTSPMKVKPESNRSRSNSTFPPETSEPVVINARRNRSHSDFMLNEGHIPELSSGHSDNSVAGNSEDAGPVIYAPLDFRAMSAIAQIKREHVDVKHFDELLKRHDVRQMEMEEKKRRNVVT